MASGRSIILLSLLSALATRSTAGVVVIVPVRPTVGSPITVQYNPSEKSARIKAPKELVLSVQVFGSIPEEAGIKEYPMKEEDGGWETTFSIGDPNANLLLFRFASGDSVDDRGDSLWSTFLYTADGSPARGAMYSRSYVYHYGGLNSFRSHQDPDSARLYIRREIEAHPDHLEAELFSLRISLDASSDSAERLAVARRLRSLEPRIGVNEQLLRSLSGLYQSAGDTSASRMLGERILAEMPTTALARSLRWNGVMKITDADTRFRLAEEFLEKENLETESRELYLSNLAYAYKDAARYSDAARALHRMKKPGFQLYNQMAWTFIEKNESLSAAVDWAARAVRESRDPDSAAMRFYKTRGDWMRNHKFSKGMVLDTYGYGLLKLGRFKEAGNQLREAYEVFEGRDLDVNARYIEALMKSQQAQLAFETGLNCVRKGKKNDRVIELMKSAFASTEKSGLHFDSLSSAQKSKFETLYADARKENLDSIKVRVRESRVSLPPADFTLKMLDGTPVTLSSLKGKVVVLDFWATWCGPCLASFPFLQKVYDRFRANPGVQFLAVNTWQSDMDYAAMIQNASTFLKERKYSFPVVIDEKVDNQFDVVKKFQAEGIPAQFIIDKDGMIAYKSLGFNGPEMEDELTMQIEMLLE